MLKPFQYRSLAIMASISLFVNAMGIVSLATILFYQNKQTHFLPYLPAIIIYVSVCGFGGLLINTAYRAFLSIFRGPQKEANKS